MNARDYFKSGDAWVWLNAGMVAIALIMVLGVIGLIAVRGLGHFWPADVMETRYTDPAGHVRMIIGEVVEVREDTAQRLREAGVTLPPEQEVVRRLLVKEGNRDITGGDFRWVFAAGLGTPAYPSDIVVLERYEWGAFHGRLASVSEEGRVVAEGTEAWPALQARLARNQVLHREISVVERREIGRIHAALEQQRLAERKLRLEGRWTPAAEARLETERQALDRDYAAAGARLASLNAALARDSAVFTDSEGRAHEFPLAKIVAATQPNAMGMTQKLRAYAGNLWRFLSEGPREANTEGGVFPAIFGTVLMVFIMTIIVTPLGVVAAIYLREYARQGVVTQVVRIAVNNLAGVPSIVYGVFGLGFLVYFLGGSLDRLFYPEAAPAPVFGTPGLLWASVTLALLTLPVVIVSTEEGLSRIPRSLKEGSLALGATKAETLWRVVLPMASPSIMTGVILAIARAAGEVAPLMLVGVVKLAPTLPVDGNAPFLHLDRKFMHLGFHIYDVGFQSPNVEAARPLVYATAFLLVVVILLLNLGAIALRNRLREKYKALED